MTSSVSTEPGTAELYHRVQQFYARQMQLLDDGAVAEWAATFTADGSFAANARPEPVVGRAAIEAGALAAARQLASEGIVRRHWLGMLSVEQLPGGRVRARCYALVISTPKGGQAGVHVSTVCEDVLVPDGGSFAVQERRVTRDDLS
ncbi:nuclear transport factor 2 family protein [Saccharothrix australiensis]|uniref:SnoaL-like protein n=1 Tax=Saccharothrix australiensis TaxID=2072 RepID=A0A495W1P5_9PSEU|nr:nuclear transport factor 2 family protein [Saccharothrix australiensis]RKT55611.1 SnoaL-like protein [Saccharothrix australiensis]